MKRIFELGRLGITSAALNTLKPEDIYSAVTRHLWGDWGCISSDDWETNDQALRTGGRLLSVYHSSGRKFWVLTEADRSATTVLLPEEY